MPAEREANLWGAWPSGYTTWSGKPRNIGYKTPQLSAAVYVADAAAPRPYETNSNAQAPPPQVYEMPAPSAYTTAGYTRPLPSAYAYDPRQPMPQQRMAVSESSLNPES